MIIFIFLYSTILWQCNGYSLRLVSVPKSQKTTHWHFFTHCPWRWNRGSSDGHFFLLLLLFFFLLHTSNFPGKSRMPSDSYLFLLLLLLFPLAFLSGELSTDSRQSSDSYLFLLLHLLFPIAFLSGELSTDFLSPLTPISSYSFLLLLDCTLWGYCTNCTIQTHIK